MMQPILIAYIPSIIIAIIITTVSLLYIALYIHIEPKTLQVIRTYLQQRSQYEGVHHARLDFRGVPLDLLHRLRLQPLLPNQRVYGGFLCGEGGAQRRSGGPKQWEAQGCKEGVAYTL